MSLAVREYLVFSSISLLVPCPVLQHSTALVAQEVGRDRWLALSGPTPILGRSAVRPSRQKPQPTAAALLSLA
jgi:hypothetical protein